MAEIMRLILVIIIFTISTYCQSEPKNELDYYPLATGNYFEFRSTYWEFPYPSTHSKHSISILGDSVLTNGEQYKILYRSGIPVSENGYYIFERIDSSDGSVYRYDNHGGFPNDEYKIDSLFAQPGDTINCSREGFSSWGYYRTVCVSVRTDTVLGVATEVKEFRDQSFIPGVNYELAKGFGFYSSLSCEFSCGSTGLVYAEIDGVSYGEKITSVEEDGNKISTNFHLSQNYPNPFNPTTKIEFSIPNVETPYMASLPTNLVVYDILGREIQTLINKNLSPGNYEVEFDATELPSGIYFYKLSSGNFTETKKMMLIR